MNQTLLDALLSFCPDPVDYFTRFRFAFTAFAGINAGQPSEPALVAMPHVPRDVKGSVLLVGKLRMDRLGADAYVVTEATADHHGQDRLFVYSTLLGGGEVTHDTEILLMNPSAHGPGTLEPLPRDDWVLSDPGLIAPDPQYRCLFTPFDDSLRHIAEYLDAHRTLQQAQRYLSLHAQRPGGAPPGPGP